jgi:tellurite resistance protein TehA-like permease
MKDKTIGLISITIGLIILSSIPIYIFSDRLDAVIEGAIVVVGVVFVLCTAITFVLFGHYFLSGNTETFEMKHYE